MKNFLFVGGGGFLGSNIIAKVLAVCADCAVTVVEPEKASVHRLASSTVKIFRCELKDIEELKKIIAKEEIDTVVHLVSTIIPESNYVAFQQEISDVIIPTIRLQEYCAERNIKFVYFSSGGTVYGESVIEDSLFSEEHPLLPISYYGLSKQMLENHIYFLYRTRNLRYVVLRPSNPYGLGQNLFGRQGLIAVALGKILTGEPISVWGDGNSVRDYIYIEDLSSVVAEIILSGSVENITLNIGSGRGYCVNEIVDILCEIVEEPVKIKYMPGRRNDVSSVVLDVSRLKSIVPFTPMDIREGIARFYKQIKDERKSCLVSLHSY